MKALLISKAFFIKVVEVHNPWDEICVDKISGMADVEYSFFNMKEEDKIHFKFKGVFWEGFNPPLQIYKEEDVDER